jgi:hypothetical protein
MADMVMAVAASYRVHRCTARSAAFTENLFHAMDFTARQQFTVAAFTVMDAGKAIHGLKR